MIPEMVRCILVNLVNGAGITVRLLDDLLGLKMGILLRGNMKRHLPNTSESYTYFQVSLTFFSFQGDQIQLRDLVSEHLYHVYVEFSPFVAGTFAGKPLKGWLLDRALHHQHARIDNWDRSTKYGCFLEQCEELTRLFRNRLIMVRRAGSSPM